MSLPLSAVGRIASTRPPDRAHAGEGSGNAAPPIDVVTARAVAPFTQLLAWSQPVLKTGAIGLFPKGREVEAELTVAAKSWTYGADLLPSRTDSDGRIVRVRSLRERP